MKTMFLLSFLLFSQAAVTQGIIYKKMNECSQNNKDIFESEADSVLSLNELPTGLYLVRSISQSLEKSENEKYFSYRKLISHEDTKDSFCIEGEATAAVKTQAFVPTMIDLTKEKSWGDAFWSLSFVSQKQTAAVQAHRSLVPVEKYREGLMKQGFTVETRQKSHKEFELKLVRKVASLKETIVILYDQF